MLLYVNDVEKTMKFYEKAFGLEIGFFHEESKQYGEMKTGTTKLGFVGHETASSHGFNYDHVSPQKNAPGVEVGFVTSDVAAAFERAVQAGAMPVSDPKQKPWGQMVSYVRDCNGFLVEICSPMGS